MASVETYSSDDELHVLVARFVAAYGAGDLVAVVLSDRNTTGIAVSQLQDSLKSYPFEIGHHEDGFTLVMLRHTKTVISDYFLD